MLWFSKTILSGLSMPSLACPLWQGIHTTSMVERARQGTRLKKRKVALKNKRAKEERLRKNPPPIPYKVELMLKSKGLWGPPKPLREKDIKPFAVDTVYLTEEFTWKRWVLEDAVKELRLHYHPTTLNRPNAIVEAHVELDLRGTKKERYLEEFSKMVPIIHSYDRGVADRTVLAFANDEEQIKAAIEAGALTAGGEDMIQEIAKGRFDTADIDHFVAHEDLADKLNPLVNVLRDKMPRIVNGMVGTDLALLVNTFARGMSVEVKKVKPSLGIADEPDYGFCVAPIGTLDMDPSSLAVNLDAILEKLEENKPRRKDPTDDAFLTRCVVRVQDGESETGQFSVIRDRVCDKRAAEQSRIFEEGQAAIAEKVREIKSRE